VRRIARQRRVTLIVAICVNPSSRSRTRSALRAGVNLAYLARMPRMTRRIGTLWAISILGLGAVPLACEATDGPSAVDAGRDDRNDARQCLCPPGERDITWEDLSCFCAQFPCPQLSELLEPVESCFAEPSSTAQGPYLRRGCGRIEYERGGYGQTRYQFDETSKGLLAARASTDLSFGPCTAAYAYQYTAGQLVNLDACPDFDECLNCRTLLPTPGRIPACTHP
jgi:hypothetical protein